MTSYCSFASALRSPGLSRFIARPSSIAVVVGSLFLLGCGEKETIEQYAKSPVGCETRPAQWYTEKITTTPGQDELRNQIRSYQIRAEYHGKQIDFASLTTAEKSEQVNKSLQCLREVMWASEALQKAGLPVK